MSALPPKADIRQRDWDVRFVPKADIDRYSIASSACGLLYILRRFSDSLTIDIAKCNFPFALPKRSAVITG
jgi:hypothetical protein